MPIYDYYGLMTNARLGRQGESPGVSASTVADWLKEHAMDPSHAAALQSKHEGLERRIQEEMSRPAPDEAVLQTLKKRKLKIKEELYEL